MRSPTSASTARWSGRTGAATITVTSTGMGCPSTAIAIEELARCGVTSFIRVGSTAALQPGIEPGDLIVSEGSFRNDGTTDGLRPEGLSRGSGSRDHPRARTGRPRARPGARAGGPRRAERHRRRVLRRVAGVDEADVRSRACSTSRWSRRRCSWSPASAGCAGRDDLRRLEQSRGGHERLRRRGPQAARRRAGARASRPRWTRPSTGACRPVGLNLHTHLEGWVRPGDGGRARRGRWASRIRPAAGTGRCGWRARRPDRLPRATWRPLIPCWGPPNRCAASPARRSRTPPRTAATTWRSGSGPSTHAGPGFDLAAVVAAACEGLDEGPPATGLPAGLVVCLLRHADPETNLAVARAAAAAAGKGVVGLDIAGDELRLPVASRRTRGRIAIAAAAGLGLTAHAAEAGPAGRGGGGGRRSWVSAGSATGRASPRTRTTLAWAAERGDRVRGLPDLERPDRRRRSIGEHPLHAFLAAGCRVVLGDDDPITIGHRLSARGAAAGRARAG